MDQASRGSLGRPGTPATLGRNPLGSRRIFLHEKLRGLAIAHVRPGSLASYMPDLATDGSGSLRQWAARCNRSRSSPSRRQVGSRRPALRPSLRARLGIDAPPRDVIRRRWPRHGARSLTGHGDPLQRVEPHRSSSQRRRRQRHPTRPRLGRRRRRDGRLRGEHVVVPRMVGERVGHHDSRERGSPCSIGLLDHAGLGQGRCLSNRRPDRSTPSPDRR